MRKNPCHKANITALRRIEGQIRGIQKMIEEERYCVDILSQLRSVVRAIGAVKKNIYKKHLENCVIETLKGNSAIEKQRKIEEVLELLTKHDGV
ncbi:MAG: metal-sensitive transcriptional regulator [Candidatus Omnitrophica bacterium]|nr:metal-sensitive transcriptional regulator [Candidatus Omnitrophota bacterium]